jgi:hypothetical protein
MKNFKELDIKLRQEIYERESKKIINQNKMAVIVESHPKSKLPLKKYIK